MDTSSLFLSLSLSFSPFIYISLCTSFSPILVTLNTYVYVVRHGTYVYTDFNRPYSQRTLSIKSSPDPNPTFAVIDIKNEDECMALNVPEYGQIMYNLFDSKKCKKSVRVE